MNFFQWLTSRPKTLSTMTATELRSQEMLMSAERDRMTAKLTKLAKEKQKIVQRGSKEKTPEMRRTMAQQFDLLHTEQGMLSRQLNIRSKELLTVSRLRMLRENAERMKGSVDSPFATIRAADMATIEKLIENDQISMEVYQQRLDDILEIGHAADAEAASGVSPAAEELLRVWNDMDSGLIENADAAFDETEKRVRERGRAAE